MLVCAGAAGSMWVPIIVMCPPLLPLVRWAHSWRCSRKAAQRLHSWFPHIIYAVHVHSSVSRRLKQTPFCATLQYKTSSKPAFTLYVLHCRQLASYFPDKKMLNVSFFQSIYAYMQGVHSV